MDNTARLLPNGGTDCARVGQFSPLAGRMEVTNSTFYGNNALNDNTFGGAIFDSHEPLKLTNSPSSITTHNPVAAIFNDGGTVDVKGNIFADHT